jgi:hypothetical protein
MATYIGRKSPKVDPVMINKTLFTLAAFSIMALATTFSVLLLRDARAPVSITRAEVLTPLIPAGGKLHIVYHTIRIRSCDTQIDQFFIKHPNGEVVHRGTVPGGYTLIGVRDNEVRVPLPDDLERGQYVYRAVLRSDCGLYNHVFVAPDAAFTVL